MKYREIGFFFILLVSFTSCTFVSKVISNEILSEFKEVDDSLKKSIRRIGNSDFEIMYDSILDNYSKYPEIIQKSDSVYYKTLQIIAYIDKVKNILHVNDSNGTSILVSQRLLVNTDLGSQLYQNLIVYHKFAEQNITNSENKKQLDLLHFNYPHYSSEKKWLEINFKNTPTVASKTILSKVKTDCYQIGLLMLKEIEERGNKVS